MHNPSLPSFSQMFNGHIAIFNAIMHDELERQKTDTFEICQRGSDRMILVRNFPVLAITYHKSMPTIHCHDHTPDDFFN